LNYSTQYGGIKVDNVDEIYFSSFEMPLRGAKYYEQTGDRFMLTNIEFRFPFIRYFLMGWPLPINIINVRGAVFTDIGTAWEDGNFALATSKNEKYALFCSNNKFIPKLKDLFMGYGFGTRMIVMNAFILRFDAAWKTDLYSSSVKPLYYFSLGSEF
jgi:outer membrane protein assembly factor BamA